MTVVSQIKIVFPNQNGALEIISDQIDEGSYFFPYMDGVIDYSVAQKITIKNQTQEGSLALSMLDTFDGQISGVISSNNGFSEINETIKITPTVLESSLSEISLITALLFAFIGGLILNLMPCVLPVIALKAFSLIKNSQNSNSSITLNASLYVFGVLATFLGIAGKINENDVDENIKTVLIEDISDLDLRFMYQGTWYERWPSVPITERKIPTLIKLEFTKNNKDYVWIIEPNIDYEFKN